MKTQMIKQAKLEENKSNFFRIGLILSLAAALVAFEWQSPIEKIELGGTPVIIDQDSMEITRPKPPEQKIEKPKVTIVTTITRVDDTKKTADIEIPDAQNFNGFDNLNLIDFEPDTVGSSTPDLFKVVEKMPEFIGGEAARMKYLRKNVKYPKEAIMRGLQGRVFVSFIVETDGSISNVNLERGIGHECDAEALRVIRNMPSWTPGIQSGKAVRVLYYTDIKFTLSD